MFDREKYARLIEHSAEAASLRTRLEESFIEHETGQRFEEKFVSVLAARERMLEAGGFEVRGTCLVGPPGSGKTTLMAHVIANHHAWFRGAPGRRFGHRVVSVTIPAGAGVKETLRDILRATNGCEVIGNRTEDYLFSRVTEAFREERVAGLHLDEFQDIGRSKAEGPMLAFVTRLRHLTQHRKWPVCLFLSGTPDAKKLINKVPTLARRLDPVEFRPITRKADRRDIASHVRSLATTAGIPINPDLFDVDHFVERLVHAGASSFGLVIQLVISALCEAQVDVSDRQEPGLSYVHFIRAYDRKSDAGDNFNPFLDENWSTIDTRRVMYRGAPDD